MVEKYSDTCSCNPDFLQVFCLAWISGVFGEADAAVRGMKSPKVPSKVPSKVPPKGTERVPPVAGS